MLNKMSLSAALMVGCAFVDGVLAAESAKSVDTYMGISAGAGFLKGARKEVSFAPGIYDRLPGSHRLSSGKPVFEFSIGAQYNLQNSKAFIAVEPYVSLAQYNSKAGGFRVPGRRETNTISSRYGAGIDFKPGIKVTERDSLFVSIGCEMREFRYKYMPDNVSTRKTLFAASYGAGYERSFGKVSIGATLKHRLYQKSTLATRTSGTDTVKSTICPHVFTAMVSLKYKI